MSDLLRRPGPPEPFPRVDPPRESDDPRTSVENGGCRSWDVPNLWACDGSVFPTTGGVNPSLTIQAIALGTADRIRATARGGSERGA